MEREKLTEALAKVASTLKVAVDGSGLKRGHLATILGIDRSSLLNYVNGSRMAPLDFLIKACFYFKISFDETIGLNKEFGVSEVSPLGIHLSEVMSEHRPEVQHICADLFTSSLSTMQVMLNKEKFKELQAKDESTIPIKVKKYTS